MSDEPKKPWTEQDGLDLRLAAAELRMLGQDDEADVLDRILDHIAALESEVCSKKKMGAVG